MNEAALSGLVDAYGRPLTADSFQAPSGFGPLTPTAAQFPDPNDEPWEYQYPAAWNVMYQPRSESRRFETFAMLRALAAMCPQAQVCFEYVRRELRGKEWAIVPVEDAGDPAAHKKYQAEIDEATQFLRRPYRLGSGLGFSSWLGQYMTELLEIDTAVIYPLRNMGGDLHSLVLVNGETIKPLLEAHGHPCGYQQILYNRPTTQYGTASLDVVGEYGAAELYYHVYNPRVDSAYGTAMVEQIASIVRTAANRATRLSEWYTEGTVPESFLIAPGEWNAAQIKEYQEWIDKRFRARSAGGLVMNAARRARMHVLPGGKYEQAKPLNVNKDESEELWTYFTAILGVPRSVVIEKTTRSTGETNKASSLDVGLLPRVVFLQEEMTEIIQRELGTKNVKWTVVDETDENTGERAQRDTAYVNAGIYTADEIRAQHGDEPLPEDAKEAILAAKTPPALLATAKPGEQPQKPGEEQTVAEAKPKPEEKPDAKAQERAARATHGTAAEEFAAWQKVALKRGARAAFVPKLIAPLDAAETRFRLSRAKTPTAIRAAFERARKRWTAAARSKAVRKLSGAVADYLDAVRERVVAQARRASGGTFKREDWSWTDLADGFRVEFSGHVASVWKLAAQDAHDTVGGDALDFSYYDDNAADYAAARGGQLIKLVDDVTRDEVSGLTQKALVEGWSGDELADALEDLSAFGDARADRIARTEVRMAQNNGTAKTYRELGVEKVVCFDGDSDEVCAERDGQVMTIDEFLAADEATHPNCGLNCAPAPDEELEEAA